ncbi:MULTISPECIES: glycosyltransferase family 4 protein [unclassified Mucilaginibacter]|uniref:glycosyltransferase family 4 protein n=1 Tax=unclassified Mucilaginibacter TaxID=2617802 RepID=UPI002AC910AB|nr:MULTISPECIES: glycosyltransferase family 4 protein [unclassified Mucilaginibacter]MEB0260649.1 glycosyltransferase family 4 protein [Mucilaginibacter sp. 10I4]MEB0277466.1 glycosyltransferase family 4 protein [Mucilaginibacter sp. 10B2]MEB0302335.1 glycosyltransferase family 4 protein [Mucilaginibacter sp. 5C4]WPX24904.1 glycosyltransferase family 4 protein [Mucilaginibacter sp. 5C4]
MSKNITLFSLQTFSTTGGIQKMTRTMAHSLNAICNQNNWDFKLASLYDEDSDLMPQYVPAQNFKGFGKKRILFIIKTVFAAKKDDVVILSHINLALVGMLIKLRSPKTKIWLIAHGIEVWRPLSAHKKYLLNQCDKVICVSNFTKAKMQALHQTDPNKCVVLNNALDPFMKLPDNFEKPSYLMERYDLTSAAPIIFTLTRLASTELYKGHDIVIKALAALKHKFPGIKYILAGNYDELEGIRVKQLIEENGVTEQVILTGFIKEEELPDHFLTADLFVLPSKKEGFGIVFIEALACGLPVICGNSDGSIDAIRNGELGTAINTDDEQELEDCITKHLAQPLTLEKRKHLKDNCLRYFNEQNYIDSLQQMLLND